MLLIKFDLIWFDLLAIEQKTELNLILVKPCVLQGETYFNIMTTSEEYNIEEIIDWCGWGENSIRHIIPPPLHKSRVLVT